MYAQDISPDNLKRGVELAYFNACEDFGRWEPADMAVSSGAAFDRVTNTIVVIYANQGYRVSFPTGEVSYADRNDAVPNPEKVVILHYLIRASGQPLKECWISFKEIPAGGMLYFEPFNKRVVNYLLAVFNNKSQLLVPAGEMLGGSAISLGSYGVKLNVLPRLPVVFAIWPGDEEFSPRATVLFDATAPLYLPTEDLVVATGFCVGKLAKAAKSIGG